ncbi:MAG: NAD(P)-dependent oxidoreductase [Sphingomonas bacterium]|uniref:SDR family NAD(P)-dependent oxidoreductase n=1 Tax=Sphingomonas bacterium TaxID=1895847 RepID=UPI00262CE0D4|nr:SDR family NAD(P)-dependent oxidoreductase [Sphingomonas bacterium]MDB5704508.1 NAD(P)-dependent oxidoreductase [Sphingomonas bacterium]
MYATIDPSTLTVFITGATSGFGEAAARRYAASGARVIVTGRRADRLEALQAELGADKCHIAPFDVTDRAAFAAALDAIPEPFSRIDTVIANAGLALGLEPAAQVDLDDWDQMVATNINGLLYTVRLLLPRLIANGVGHIVTLGSVAGDYPYPNGSVYAASKAFVKQLALALRSDVQGKNIRVTNIEPGLAKTEFSAVRFKGDEELADRAYQDTQFMTADDIVEAIFWATTLPRHVNINRIQMMPVTQAFAGFDILRQK